MAGALLAAALLALSSGCSTAAAPTPAQGGHLSSTTSPGTPGTSRSSGSKGSTAPVFAPPAGFGGYQLEGAVSAISATWRVPRIARSSPVGGASTWVGTDNEAGDFIQLGVIENSLPHGAAHAALYEAFWSDTNLHYEAQILLPVRAGDEVSATMSYTSSGWRLAFFDRSRGTSKVFASGYGAGESFTRSEWLQEDPVVSLGSLQDKAYPTMEAPRLSRVLVDGRVPSLSYEDAQVLSSPNGVYLVPTRFRRDRFGFHVPDPVQLQYLEDVAPFDHAIDDLGVQISKLGTDDAARAGGPALFGALHHLIRELDAQPWPRSISRDVKRFAAQQRRLAELLHRWMSARPVARGALQSRFTLLASRDGIYADPLRAAIGLPPAA